MRTQILKNKYLYKVMAITVKYMPSVLAILQMIILCINYSGMVVPILSIIGGTSIAFLILLYLLSYLFQYCYLYRMPLSYNLIINITATLKAENLLPLDTLILFRLIMIFTGIFIAIFVFLMYKNRNNPKVGGIKHFCERYCDCKF